MDPVQPPPLLPCRDLEASRPGLCEEHYRALFKYLYVDCHWYASLPKGEALRVRFRPRNFNHAFFKEPSKGAQRTVWRPDRVERILWIGYTVENPAEVRRVGAGRLNFLIRTVDDLSPWYMVVTDRAGRGDGNRLEFVTAYPVTHHGIRSVRKIGDTLLRR